MSISKIIAQFADIKLVLPSAGLLIQKDIGSDNSAICYTINKGYFEASTANDMLLLLDNFSSSAQITYVKKVDGIKSEASESGNGLVYRQRIFFTDLSAMLLACRTFGVLVEVNMSKFKITQLHAKKLCKADVTMLQKIARSYGEDLSTYLTSTCLVQFNGMLEDAGLLSNLGPYIEEILGSHKGYLDRAPFLQSKETAIVNKEALYLGLNTYDDTSLYTKFFDSEGLTRLSFGFTTENRARWK